MTIWVVYRDVTGFPRQQFERLPKPKPGDLVIRDLVLPGMYGFPDMYVRKHHFHINEDVVHLITYTERELSSSEAQILAQQYLSRPKGERPS